jgi:hypothetical protein
MFGRCYGLPAGRYAGFCLFWLQQEGRQKRLLFLILPENSWHSTRGGAVAAAAAGRRC